METETEIGTDSHSLPPLSLLTEKELEIGTVTETEIGAVNVTVIEVALRFSVKTIIITTGLILVVRVKGRVRVYQISRVVLVQELKMGSQVSPPPQPAGVPSTTLILTSTIMWILILGSPTHRNNNRRTLLVVPSITIRDNPVLQQLILDSLDLQSHHGRVRVLKNRESRWHIQNLV
jgi:hypothetical protein